MKTAVALSLLASVGYAGGMYDGNRILGFEATAATVEADTFGLLGERDHKGDDVEFGIRLGAENTEWRSMLLVNYFDSSDDDQEYWKVQGTFDYLLLQDNTSFHPFIGINLGYISYSTSNPTGDDDDSGILYGGQIGMLWRAAESLEIDISYRYSFSNADYVNHTEGVVFGLNYMF